MGVSFTFPVKPLVRFKSVCKNWYALIQNPSFVSLHCNRAAAENTDCVLVKRSLNGGGKGSITLSLVPNETSTQDIVISSTDLDNELRLLGHCNGVVCLSGLAFNQTIILCNPSIREFRVLPQSSYKTDHFSNLGFGFDPYTNDYKVVKFEFRHIYSSIDETIEIYDLSTDSWRKVVLDSSFGFGLNFKYSSCSSWNGDFYWFACGPSGDRKIIAFRMSNEVFDVIPVPEVCSLDNSRERRLFVLNDSLALVLYTSGWELSSHLEKCFDIWIMEEQGVEVSWTKKFTIGPLKGIYFALGFRLNGEFLFEGDRGQLMSYHIDTQQIKKYQVYGHWPPGCLQVLLYNESLVSVKRHNERDGHDDLHP
ncbi:F-box protein At3g07870-like [Rhododendron vialii]|uniref:F-box protein At3g07870-like n=1 Tax=Rhododendron vialii TaxID=182163 RepID=UPI00265F4C4F|nr:F-box protein At3g07870-like [Rhododendron vialii]